MSKMWFNGQTDQEEKVSDLYWAIRILLDRAAKVPGTGGVLDRDKPEHEKYFEAIRLIESVK